jgi:SAP domain-containing ribonucleoprotein
MPKHALEAPKPASATTAVTMAAQTDAEAVLNDELEKRKRRAERFGIPLGDSIKAIERAKRFGTTAAITEESKQIARAKRFGNQVWKKNGNTKRLKPEVKSPLKQILDDPVEVLKAKKRAERFGGGNDTKKIKT